MDVLVDTGALLRLIIPSDPGHFDARRAIKLLRRRGDKLITLTQNFNILKTGVSIAIGDYAAIYETPLRRCRYSRNLCAVGSRLPKIQYTRGVPAYA